MTSAPTIANGKKMHDCIKNYCTVRAFPFSNIYFQLQGDLSIQLSSDEGGQKSSEVL